jgi:endonuclease G
MGAAYSRGMRMTGRVLLVVISGLVACGGAAAPLPPQQPETALPLPTGSPTANFRERQPPSRSIESSVHVAMGIPKDSDDSDDYLMDKVEYVTSYNSKLNVPNWASWRLDAQDVGAVDRQNDFRGDDELPAAFYHVVKKDYEHSGFDQGHLCPSKDRSTSAEKNSLTFLETNMHPQVKELNEVRWKNLEDYSRKLAVTEHKELYIVAGGLFDAHPTTIGHGVAVPKANYKIVVVLEGGQSVESVARDTQVIAVIMPNDHGVKDKKWTEYLVTVDEIERRSGYDFLSKVPVGIQRAIQSKAATIALRE